MLSFAMMCARNALALIFIFASSVLALGAPLATLSRHDLVPPLLIATGYALYVMMTETRRRLFRNATGVNAAICMALVAYAIVSLILVASGTDTKNTVALYGIAAALFMIALDAIATNWGGVALGVTAISVAILVTQGFGKTLGADIKALRNKANKGQIVESRTFLTEFYNIKLKRYNAIVPMPAFKTDKGVSRVLRRGGGLSIIGDKYLLGTADGRIYTFSWNKGSERIEPQDLGLRVPINNEDFIADTDNSVDHRNFRVTDVLVQQTGGITRLFATYHVWKTQGHCSVMRVSYVESSTETFIDQAAKLRWKNIFETTPCLPLTDRTIRFGGLQSGGRMALLDAHNLLVTFGDHQFDGYYQKVAVSQDLNTSYGKLFKFNIESGTHELLSWGLRNPQGLFVDSHGMIWSTEHGPRGGDELNLLVAGGNYGWPLVTLGTAYEKTSWPLNKTPGRHDGFIPPVFAWVPSIGVSNLVRVQGPLFDLWRDDLLVASLGDVTLERLRVDGQRVVYSEPFRIGCRIRDIQQAVDGSVMLWCDDERAIITLRPAEPESDGERLFIQCEGCHSIIDSRKRGIGPDLDKLAQRNIASKPGFEYSAALKRLGDHAWTTNELDRFLRSPRDFAPGTAMDFQGIQDDKQRAGLVQYLMNI